MSGPSEVAALQFTEDEVMDPPPATANPGPTPIPSPKPKPDEPPEPKSTAHSAVPVSKTLEYTLNQIEETGNLWKDRLENVSSLA